MAVVTGTVQQLSDDEMAIRDAVRGIAARFGPDYYQEQVDTGGSCAELWNALGRNGYLGMHLPEEYGGAVASACVRSRWSSRKPLSRAAPPAINAVLSGRGRHRHRPQCQRGAEAPLAARRRHRGRLGCPLRSPSLMRDRTRTESPPPLSDTATTTS